MKDENGADRVRIRFRGSKTDREMKGTFRTLGRSSCVELCPVRAVGRLLAYHWSSAETCKLAKLHEVITSTEVTKWIKLAAEVHKLDKSRYASHSVRAGGATALYKGGADLLLIQYFGRWTSEAYRVYCRLDEKDSMTVMFWIESGLGCV